MDYASTFTFFGYRTMSPGNLIGNIRATDATLVDDLAPTTSDSLNINFKYQNLTNADITVSSRAGISFKLTPQSAGATPPGFYITVNFNASRNVKFDSSNQFNAVGENLTTELDKLKDNFNRNIHLGNTSSEIVYMVTKDEIAQSGGVFYIRNCDVVVSLSHLCPNPIHPYSELGIKNTLIDEHLEVENTYGFSCKMRLVDNDGRLGRRFVNIAGSVYVIPTIKDISMKDGLYVTHSGAVASNMEHPISNVTVVELQDVDKREIVKNVFRTYEEAFLLGDEIAEKEKELKQQTLEHQKQLLLIKKDKEENERRHDLLVREKDRIKEEVAIEESKRKQERDELDHLRTLNQMNRKDYYENRSYERKDTSELLKYIPVFITGLASMFAIMKSLK